MGIATKITNLICQLRFCRRRWPGFIALVDKDGRNFIANTRYVSTGDFFPHEHVKNHSQTDGAHVI